MPVFAPVGLVLAIDVVAHQQGAEMAIHVIELQLLDVIAFVGEYISEDFVGDWAHADHFGDLQSARVLSARQVGIPILSFPLDCPDLS